jgi:hypothetical protein
MSMKKDKTVMFEEVKDMEVTSESSAELPMSGCDQGLVKTMSKFHMLKKIFMPWKWKKKKS